MLRLVALLLFVVAVASPARAESVFVKYRGEVPLDSFECHDTERSSLVGRVCYDAAQRYMVIKLKETYYHYCEIDAETVAALLAAKSMGSFYLAHIRGDGEDGPFDCRSHRIPDYPASAEP
jgi:hypothetical protein